ncbi:hypothetical protein ACIQRS_06850 [Streptomyces termitum]|uniref:Uncharacterized protein n=1 Tax=Streptomyces termitum TaxID=67368 RepID=A0A918W495_9ACTN|nr:hypothetical protein [Streptomyces termitum]GHA66743.1 hypothetical protein GCM10010305_05890 [Streptomyces termitum]
MADTNDERPRGGIHITNTGGNVTIGDRNTVTHTVHHGAGPARDPRQEELLQAVRRLRTDLGAVVESEATTALDTELAGTEAEIEETGAAAPGRLARLGRALGEAGDVAGLLASGVAVGQALAALLGS